MLYEEIRHLCPQKHKEGCFCQGGQDSCTGSECDGCADEDNLLDVQEQFEQGSYAYRQTETEVFLDTQKDDLIDIRGDDLDKLHSCPQGHALCPCGNPEECEGQGCPECTIDGSSIHEEDDDEGDDPSLVKD